MCVCMFVCLYVYVLVYVCFEDDNRCGDGIKSIEKGSVADMRRQQL
jgi:hypothetical protein